MLKQTIILSALLLASTYSFAAPQPQSQKATKNRETQLFPARPAKIAGRTSCNTRCINGQCWRTYDSGRKVKIRAKQQFNPFNQQWEFQTPPC